jgi:sulfide:quinone oxidoreductase
VKQGGIAALQADAAAEAIAALAGAPVEPAPFRPVLRSVLVTGEGPRYLSSGGVDGRAPASGLIAGKIAAPLLAPYLAERLAAGAA